MLEVADQLNADTRTWKIKTGVSQGKRVSFAEPQREIFVKLQCTPDTLLRVTTEQGDFEVVPTTLTAGRKAPGVETGKGEKVR